MSRGPENTFIASVHRHLPPALHFEKMHNAYRGGTADVWYSGPERDLWIEYKYLDLPKRDDTIVDLCAGKNPPLSKLQQLWLFNRHQEGRNVWVILGTKGGGIIYYGHGWECSYTVAELHPRLLDRKALAGEIADFVGAPP